MANETEGAPSRRRPPKPVVSGGVDPSLAPRLSRLLRPLHSHPNKSVRRLRLCRRLDSIFIIRFIYFLLVMGKRKRNMPVWGLIRVRLRLVLESVCGSPRGSLRSTVRHTMNSRYTFSLLYSTSYNRAKRGSLKILLKKVFWKKNNFNFFFAFRSCGYFQLNYLLSTKRSPGAYGLLTEPMDNASVKDGYYQRQINTGSALSLQTVLADLADSSALIPRS